MRIILEIDELSKTQEDLTIGPGELSIEMRLIKNNEYFYNYTEVFKGKILNRPYNKIIEADFKHTGSQEIAILNITERAKVFSEAYEAILTQYPGSITREDIQYQASLQKVIASGLKQGGLYETKKG